MSTTTTRTPARLSGLLDAWQAEPTARRVLEQVGRAQLVDVSGSDGSRPFLVAALARAARRGRAGRGRDGNDA